MNTTTATRQSRKGEISTWKAHAPAFAGKMAVEAVDRAMRGQTSPSPIYEGEDGVIAWMLDGPDASYDVPLPAPGEARLLSPGIAARINRVLAFGVTARVELDGINGSTGQHFEVELTRERVLELGLKDGQAVRLIPSRLKVFEREGASA